MATAGTDRIQHGEHRSGLGAAARAGLCNEAGTILRQARRTIADEQALAEPRRRFDVVLPCSGRKVPDRVGMRTGSVALLGALDVGRQWRR